MPKLDESYAPRPIQLTNENWILALVSRSPKKPGSTLGSTLGSMPGLTPGSTPARKTTQTPLG